MSGSEQEPAPAGVPGREGLGTRLLVAVLVGLGLAALLVQGVQEAKQATPVEEGEPAPDFKAERYGGGELSLSELKGKVVMLDFWATWCGPCVEELPILVKLAAEYESRGLALVAADRIETDSKAAVDLFVSTRAPPLSPNAHVVFVPDEVLDQYKVHGLPTLFFIDREGRVQSSHVGYAPEPRLRARIEKALAQ